MFFKDVLIDAEYIKMRANNTVLFHPETQRAGVVYIRTLKVADFEYEDGTFATISPASLEYNVSSNLGLYPAKHCVNLIIRNPIREDWRQGYRPENTKLKLVTSYGVIDTPVEEASSLIEGVEHCHAYNEDENNVRLVGRSSIYINKDWVGFKKENSPSSIILMRRLKGFEFSDHIEYNTETNAINGCDSMSFLKEELYEEIIPKIEEKKHALGY